VYIFLFAPPPHESKNELSLGLGEKMKKKGKVGREGEKGK